VVAVEGAEADVVELVVVFAGEPLAALIALPDPLLEAVFDFLLFVPRRFGGRSIDDVAVGLRVMVVNRGGAQIQCLFE
jgi:hypothetical protein